jgi:hypothetical protein
MKPLITYCIVKELGFLDRVRTCGALPRGAPRRFHVVVNTRNRGKGENPRGRDWSRIPQFFDRSTVSASGTRGARIGKSFKLPFLSGSLSLSKLYLSVNNGHVGSPQAPGIRQSDVDIFFSRLFGNVIKVQFRVWNFIV